MNGCYFSEEQAMLGVMSPPECSLIRERPDIFRIFAPMLSLDNIAISYGSRTLFDTLSLSISPHDRIGLVGSNGSGKSTLLKIVAGIIPPDSGSVNKGTYVSVGYLPQDGMTSGELPLSREVATAFDDLLAVHQKLEAAHNTLAHLPVNDPLAEQTLEVIGELQHRLEELDAYRMESKIERVLMGLGFSVSDFSRSSREFSGGWQMRIMLAKLLLREPNVLLLDEPTNHLDLDSLQWLEEYLIRYDGAIILVSHDRRFLDTLTKNTLAIERGHADYYAGNYSYYETESELRKGLLTSAYKNQQLEIERTQEFIDRFRYKATKARQVQSRIKRLEKMERIDLKSAEDDITFTFPQPQPSGRIVMEVQSLRKSYGDLVLFDDLDIQIERGDRIAIVGVNGAGKSTFARILAGVESFDAGKVKRGHNVSVSYFAQHQAEDLNPSKEVLQTLQEVAEGEIRKNLRTLLGSFLFHGDDVFKKVAVLSGGEKSRLALAKMLLQSANFLIMDEPTNHLDMRSKQVLKDALLDFDGTLAIVSHDRAFLDPLVNKVWEFSNGRLRTHLGTVSEYIERKRGNREQEVPQEVTQGVISARDRRRIEAERRQALSAKLRPLRKQLGKIETTIADFEDRKHELERRLGDPSSYRSSEEAKSLTDSYREIQKSLEHLYGEWESLMTQITGIEETH